MADRSPLARLLTGGPQPPETTSLTPDQQFAFELWIRDNAIRDLDHPESHYDYRGYWRDIAAKGRNETGINPQDHRLHYPDTYKQHGHPSFSVESQYSRGPQDGGSWLGDVLIAPPVASHRRTK